MMKVMEKQVYDCLYDRDSGAIIEDVVFSKCAFLSCSLSMTQSIDLRTTVRNVVLQDCEQRGSTLDCAIVEDTLVDGFKTHGTTFQTWGAVFKHVTLKGKIDIVMVSPFLESGIAPPDVQHAFDIANREYYAEVDWALDISQAEFKDCDIRGIPARLIKRDPETQAVVTRKKALQGEWKKLDLSGTYFDTCIDFLLLQEQEDYILVAPKRDKNFKRYMEGIELLRKAGVAEPD